MNTGHFPPPVGSAVSPSLLSAPGSSLPLLLTAEQGAGYLGVCRTVWFDLVKKYPDLLPRIFIPGYRMVRYHRSDVERVADLWRSNALTAAQ